MHKMQISNKKPNPQINSCLDIMHLCQGFQPWKESHLFLRNMNLLKLVIRTINYYERQDVTLIDGTIRNLAKEV